MKKNEQMPVPQDPRSKGVSGVEPSGYKVSSGPVDALGFDTKGTDAPKLLDIKTIYSDGLQLPDQLGPDIPLLESRTDFDDVARKYAEGPDEKILSNKLTGYDELEEYQRVETSAAKILVNDNLKQQHPINTEMPDGTIYESPIGKPAGVETTGAFGPIEQRVAGENRKPKQGWIGTAFVDPRALDGGLEPQAAAAPPPPPPNEPPEDGPPPPYDKNEMPDGVYDKASLKPTNEFPEEGVDNIIPAESYDTKPNQTETIEEVIDAESSKYKNNFPPEPEKP